MDKSSRFFKLGYRPTIHKGKVTKNIVSSKKWETVALTLRNIPSNIALVPNGMEGRPDLIADKVYGSSSLWWVICVANNISDPFEELKAGNQIILPIID